MTARPTPLVIDILTLFPRMLQGFTRESMIGRAIDGGLVNVRTTNVREFTRDRHRSVDLPPYGGGPGMVMRPEPLCDAIDAVRTSDSTVVLMTPQGRRFEQSIARELVEHRHLVLVCGHYEGVDERVRTSAVDMELSIGDYVLTNGALAAAVVTDAVVRLVPGVLGGDGATESESFSESKLEYPQYTRPVSYKGMDVPEVLRSGHHGAIAKWRSEMADARSKERRPDLSKDEE